MLGAKAASAQIPKFCLSFASLVDRNLNTLKGAMLLGIVEFTQRVPLEALAERLLEVARSVAEEEWCSLESHLD